MPCCKCEVYNWSDPQPELEGQDCCLFHAPAEHKGMAVKDFNAQVFARIDEFKVNNTDADKFCILTGTIFPGEISFKAYGEDNPLPRIDFSEAQFRGMADFGGATFSDRAFFWEAVFDQMAYFRAATFSSSTGFQAATFSRSAHFDAATFSGEASFQAATFCVKAGKADFRQATFSSKADFGKTTFDGVANFREVKAEKNALHLHSPKIPTLSNLSFSSMETECFSFKGCDWPEKLWPETQEKPDYKACEELYRSLKQKAASEHDQPMVSKWHYREKLMALEQIKAKRGWIGRLGLTGLYYWCSGFGEEPAQAFRVLAGLLVVSLLALSGLKLWETGMETLRPDWDKILEIPAELLAQVHFVKSGASSAASAGGVLTPVKKIVASCFQILIAIQVSLFTFALRNRFRR